MLHADRRRLETKTFFRAFAKRPVLLVGLISANAILLSLSFLANSHLSPEILISILVVINHYLLNVAHFGLNKDSESRLPQFGERMFLLFLPKDVSECVLGDLSEEYAAKSKKFGARRARIWIYKQLITSIPHLLWRNLKIVVRTHGFRILMDPNRKDP